MLSVLLQSYSNLQTSLSVFAFPTITMSPSLEEGIDALLVEEKSNTNGHKPTTSKGPGMDCQLKNLYQKEDERGRTTWTEKYPDDVDEAAENEATAKFAILVRNKKSFDPRKKLEIDSIVVQSPLLKVVLSKVLKEYPGKS